MINLSNTHIRTQTCVNTKKQERKVALSWQMHLLQLPWSLAVAFSFQFPVKVAQFGLKVSLVGCWGSGISSLSTYRQKERVNKKICFSKRLCISGVILFIRFLVITLPLFIVLTGFPKITSDKDRRLSMGSDDEVKFSEGHLVD